MQKQTNCIGHKEIGKKKSQLILQQQHTDSSYARSVNKYTQIPSTLHAWVIIF